MTAKELREEAAKRSKRVRELANLAEERAKEVPPKTLTDEERAEFDRTAKEHEDLVARAKVQERADGIDAEMRDPAGDPDVGRDDYDGDEERKAEEKRTKLTKPASEEQRVLAVNAWFRCNTSRGFDLTAEHRDACRAVGLNPRSNELVINLPRADRFRKMQRAFLAGPAAGAEQRALSAVTAADGGALTAPESMVNMLEVNMLAFGGVLAAAEIMRTPGRERIGWPTINDTTNKGRRLNESAVTTSTAQPTAAKVYWDVYKYTSDEILVPYELLEATPFDLPSVLGALMGERIGRKFADDGTTGTGVNQPAGIVTKAGTRAAGSATAIAWDDLENLIAAIDPAYRIGAAFMFHDTIRSELKKLKDGVGRPLWQDGPNGEAPPSLKGYPWFINQSMDSTIAAAKKTVLFGKLSAYKVRQVNSIRIYRLIERHRENDQDAFLAFNEMDGNLLDAGTVPVKALLH